MRGLAWKGELIFMGPVYVTAQITFIATLLLFTVFAINLTREVLNSLHFVILQIRMKKKIYIYIYILFKLLNAHVVSGLGKIIVVQ